MSRSIATLLALLLLIAAVADVSIIESLDVPKGGDDNGFSRANAGNSLYIADSTATGPGGSHRDTHRCVAALNHACTATIGMVLVGRIVYSAEARPNPSLALLIAGRSPPSSLFVTFE